VKPKKHLSFSSLIKIISQRVLQIEDPRQEAKTRHEIHDCCLSGFAMMYFQDPSMLEFQTRLQKQNNINNLKTMFDVRSIPKSTQLRDVIDIIPSQSFDPIFSDFFRALQRDKQLEKFQFLNGMYLIPIDGTQYFSSSVLSCPSCLIKNHRNGDTTYSHQVLAASIVHPDHRQVIPLAPEPIHNIDGRIKQDCERNAGKRLLQKIRKTHPKLKIIIAGDDLYANYPFIDELRINGMSFILVAKPGDHTFLFNCLSILKQQDKTNRLEFNDTKGRRHIYQWVNGIPLNETRQADNVNYLEYSIMNGDRAAFHCGWVTDIPIDQTNIEILVKGGRARWKIENENFNTLKNLGYHAEHNFGHGVQHASFNFFLFTLLAFFVHQILELTDPLYQQCRSEFSSRKEYWNQLRCTIRILVFNDFKHLLQFIISPPEEAMPP
jgi:hypothetical protein